MMQSLSTTKLTSVDQSLIAANLCTTTSPRDSLSPDHWPSDVQGEFESSSTGPSRCATRTTSFVSRLPPEVLSYIFHLYAPDDPPGLLDAMRLGWLKVTHVSCRWRRVALDDSALWGNNFSFRLGENWAWKIRSRSKLIPLVIDHREHHPSRQIHSIATRMIAAHLDAARALRIECRTSAQMAHYIRKLCIAHPAPKLERFHAVSETRISVLTLPPGSTLFAGNAPKIRDISLDRVYILHPCFPSTPLRRLEISFPSPSSYWPEPKPSAHAFDDLFHLLSGYATLETLTLKHCFPSDDVLHGSIDFIGLPNLSDLTIDGSCIQVARVFELLNIPSSASISLGCIVVWLARDISSAAILLPPLSTHFTSVDALQFRSVCLNILDKVESGSDLEEIDIAASVSLPPRNTFPSGAWKSQDAQLRVTFDPDKMLSYPKYFIHFPTLQQLFSALPLAELRFLELKVSAKHRSPQNWVLLFSRCTNLATVALEGSTAVAAFLRAITPADERSGRGAETPFLMLESVVVKGVDFSWLPPGSNTNLWDGLLRALELRKHRNIPVRSLEITGSSFGGTHFSVEELEALVLDLRVDWHGTERRKEACEPGAIPMYRVSGLSRSVTM
ncbi:hypothetical protein BC834DRAFT_372308 [Gloeopeniophorella convolvens]|nr:hypothetical protein BC834DRAFT_372308 [Gloeopeniophorella convolvens]